jgi:hypothetical protein
MMKTAGATGITCENNAPSWFTGHWRDWHRGHGCDKDDGRPRTAEGQREIDNYEIQGRQVEQRSFSVWHDAQKQWDPDRIAEPTLRCRAGSEIEAAERFADSVDYNLVSVIVRDDNAGTYRFIELTRRALAFDQISIWSVKYDSPTSLAELSES